MNLRTEILSILALLCIAGCSDKVSYLDDGYPGLIPRMYADGIVNVNGRFQQNLTMSPDGNEHLITITDSSLWRYERILRIRKSADNIVIDTPQFVLDFKYQNEWFIGEPMISPDNMNLYFIADYPPDIWRVARSDTQDWTEPIRLTDISTDKDDWYVTLAKNKNLYFTNGIVYKSEMDNGKYNSKSSLEGAFNFDDVRDPCISPDEDYMIITVEDTLSNHQSDLYVTFKDEESNWSQPQNLGKDINTEHREFAPYISPDEKFLFFSRRDKWQNAKFSNVYWVSLKVIDQFRII